MVPGPAKPGDVSLARLLGDQYNRQQPDFILGSEFEICWVGGLGCGKTYAGCIAGLRHGLKYGSGARVLFGRRTFREIEGSIKQDFFELVRDKGLVHLFERPTVWDYHEGTNVARLKNGAEFMFGNLETPDKLKNFQWSAAIVDQLEEVPWDVYEMLLQRVRWKGVPGDDRHVWSIANDEGDNWIRRRFLTYEAPHGRPTKLATRKLIRGVSFDNPHLDAHARAQLLAMDAETQRRYIYADMTAGTTRLLPDFRVLPAFEIPAHWPRWVGIDPARSTGVTCAEWVTVNPDSDAYRGVLPNAPHIYREYWDQGRDAELHAHEIIRLSDPHRLRGRIMDRSAWHSVALSKKHGSLTVASFYLSAGLPVSPSDGDEWVRVNLFIEAQKRGLTVSDACPHLLRQGPEYRIRGQASASGRVFVKGKQTFHAIDAGGYALSTLPTRVAPVDLRLIAPAYQIGPNVDHASRLHWEQELKTLPLRRGRDSIVTQGFDEADFFPDETRSTHAGSTEDIY